MAFIRLGVTNSMLSLKLHTLFNLINGYKADKKNNYFKASIKSFAQISVLSCVLFITGCPSTSHQNVKTNKDVENPVWLAHQEAVKSISHYQTRGNFAYLEGKNRQSARFFWEQLNSDDFQLKLLNPLGKTVIEMNVTAELTEIIDSNGKHYQSSDPQTAIQQLAKMDIPVKNLREWMLGLPGESTNYVLNDEFLLQNVTLQDESADVIWRVEYLDYDSEIKPILPKSIEITQEANGEKRLTIKLKLNNWNIIN